jgi:hypothetical protein
MENDPSSSYSMILIKCGTLATAPRIDGVSGRSTIWFSFVNPRLRTISLCFTGHAMVLR